MIECEGDVYILTESARGKHASGGGGGGTLRRVVARQLSRRYNFVLKMNDISSTHSAPLVCVCVCRRRRRIHWYPRRPGIRALNFMLFT